MTHDLIVVGAGPAGLGAALAAARDGARVALVEASDTVGGLCITFRRDDAAYDLGGHILFVDGDARRAWLEELLGGELLWVNRPVASAYGRTIHRGRYLDHTAEHPDVFEGGPSADDFVTRRYGAATVGPYLRDYLAKVDGLPVEQIVAARPQRLLLEQGAPDGFWYPAGGVGQLMDAMARAVVTHGGQVLCGHRVNALNLTGGVVDGITITGPDGPRELSAPRVITALPPALVAQLVMPAAPPEIHPRLAPRAAAIVYLQVACDRVSEEPWVQVADPDVPFSRLFEPKNWSARLVPRDHTVLGCEVYCSPTADDRWWPLSDEALGGACRQALIENLGLLDEATPVTLTEVVRRPHAWSVVRLADMASALRPAEWLAQIDGLTVAQGGDLMRAIAAGERAATATDQLVRAEAASQR